MFQRWLVWPLVAAIMGFALGGSFVWGVLYVPPEQYAAHNNQTDHGTPQQEHKNVFWEKAADDPVAYFTLWLVGFTGVLAVSTIGLWGVTWRASRAQARDMQASVAASEKSVEIASDAMVAGERAFVFATGFGQFWEFDAVNRHYNWRFRPIWRNSGNTPTNDLTISTICEVRDAPLPDDFDFDIPGAIVGSGLLGPKYENSGGLAPQYPLTAVTAQDIRDVQNGAKFIYLIGWARYRDVFPNTKVHITRFCWVILPTGDPFAFVPKDPDRTLDFPYAHHHRGNSAAD